MAGRKPTSRPPKLHKTTITVAFLLPEPHPTPCGPPNLRKSTIMVAFSSPKMPIHITDDHRNSKKQYIRLLLHPLQSLSMALMTTKTMKNNLFGCSCIPSRAYPSHWRPPEQQKARNRVAFMPAKPGADSYYPITSRHESELMKNSMNKKPNEGQNRFPRPILS